MAHLILKFDVGCRGIIEERKEKRIEDRPKGKLEYTKHQKKPERNIFYEKYNRKSAVQRQNIDEDKEIKRKRGQTRNSTDRVVLFDSGRKKDI